MSLFIAVFEDPIPEEIVRKAKELSGDEGVHQLSEVALLIRGYFDNTRVIASILRMDDEADSPRTGIVFKLDGSYAGYHGRSVWDWLENAREWISGLVR